MGIFFKRLYVRIWLAVVLAVAVLTLLVGWAWRMAAEAPLREMVVRNEAGQVIGHGRARLLPRPPNGEAGSADLGVPQAPEKAASGSPDDAPTQAAAADDAANPPADKTVPTEARRKKRSKAESALRRELSLGSAGTAGNVGSAGNLGNLGNGPEFEVKLDDGSLIHVHLPRPPRPLWYQRPFSFFWTLALVAIAVALATYPIVRKLTRRLEALQRGVEKWGEGDLSVRVPTAGQDEVAFLAARFNQAGERIESLVKSHETLLASQRTLLASQKSLLANASHELRSPLTRIRMALELLEHNSPAAAKSEIANNIVELDQLVDEILLASRLDSREADLGSIESVDLTGLVAEECARAHAALDTSLSGPSPLVRGVNKLLRRAVRNLLENARRHAAGEVQVLIEREGDRAYVRVCDRGPGVPPDQRERIFEPFYRLPGATERDGGVGLGLALVKSIALRHGGSAYCENRAGGGACFVVSLPLAA